ncbi:helix-turn-helix domain-containing protein [Marinobacter similis]
MCPCSIKKQLQRVDLYAINKLCSLLECELGDLLEFQIE